MVGDSAMVHKDSDHFGKLDLGWDDPLDSEPTPSGVRHRPSEDKTRVVPAAAPSAPPPPQSGQKKRPSQEMTRVGSVGGTAEKGSTSSPASVRDPRIDELRKLYAKGDADAALAFASRWGGGAEPYADIQDSAGIDVDISFDRPRDPSIVVTVSGEEEIDLPDEGDDIHVTEGTAIFAPSSSAQQVTAMSGTPYVTMVMSEVSRLPLDPRAGFLIQMIDGNSSVSDLCDLAGMPEDEVKHVLSELAHHKVIDFK